MAGQRARQLLTMEHMTGVCDGLLVEHGESIGECDLGDACQALGSRDDYPAYRAAHGRVIDSEQSGNQDEYGGEARLRARERTLGSRSCVPWAARRALGPLCVLPPGATRPPMRPSSDRLP